MEKKFTALVVLLALAAMSMHAGAAIQPGDRLKMASTPVSSGDVLPAGIAWDLALGADRSSSGNAASPAPAPADRVKTAVFFPAVYVSAAVHGGVAPSGSAPATSDATALSVPEPGTWAVLLAGLLGVGAIARRRMPS